MEVDRNTKMFHNMAYRKKVKEKFFEIEHDGQVLSDQKLIEDSAVQYFHNSFSDNIPLTGAPNFENFGNQVPNHMNELLCKPPDEKELKEVIFSLNKSASA